MSTRCTIPYGKTTVNVEVPAEWRLEVVKPHSVPVLKDPDLGVKMALEALGDGYSSGKRRSVAVAVNDHTRPVPHAILLPGLLRWLEGSGYRPEEITFIIASGTHLRPSSQVIDGLVPPKLTRGCRLICHDAWEDANLTDMGRTAQGTICRVNAVFARADLKIVVGNVEPHQFMGWSGGTKSAAIGLGGYDTIEANHSLLTLDGCGPCRYRDNPMRMDVEEMGRLIGVDLALNVVMNDERRIVDVFAGPPEAVMERAVVLAGSIYTVRLGEPADLVIAAPGGHPKDINFYQAQKSLGHSASVARAGAPIILVAACPDGVGHEAYQSWMEEKTSHAAVKSAFENQEFRLGPHKGMLVAKDAADRRVMVVSELDDAVVTDLLLEPFASVQEAVDDVARGWVSPDSPPRVIIVPYGNATVPVVS